MITCEQCDADITERVQAAYQAGRNQGRLEYSRELIELIEQLDKAARAYWVTGDPPPPGG